MSIRRDQITAGAARRACVDGPVGSRVTEKSFDPVRLRSCVRPFAWRRAAAGPDGFREPRPNGIVTLLAATLHGFCGSSVRPISIFSLKPSNRRQTSLRRQPAVAGRPPRSSSWPTRCGPFCWPRRRRPACAACGRAVAAATTRRQAAPARQAVAWHIG